MASRPVVLALNVIETMFSLDAVRHRMQDAGLPGSSLDLWFARIVRDGLALTAGGNFKPFVEIAQSLLVPLLDQYTIEPTSQKIASIMEGFAELEVQPDVEPAIHALQDAGVRVVTLTNGSREMTEAHLRRSGLSRYVERIYSVDDVQHWKPHPAVYEHAAMAEELPPQKMALIAVHSWDIMGAKRVGYTTGWASRLESRFAPAMGEPDVSGTSLFEVVKAMLALPPE